MGELTEKTVQAALKRALQSGRMQRLADGDWLTLLVTRDGVGRWQQGYRYGGKERSISHGTYGAGMDRVSIAEARHRAAEARALLRDGIDPVEHRRAQKAALRVSVANTFGAAAEAWFAFNEPQWAKATAEKARQYLDKDLLPSLRTRPVANLTPQDLGAAMDKISGRGAHNVAKKARQWCKAIFRYAIAKGWTKQNPAEHLNDIAAPAPAATNYAHLGADELPELLSALDGYTGSALTRGAIWLALWTANRPGITRTLRWTELDLDDALWTIEKGRAGMKRGYAHLTPLPRQAVALLRDLYKLTGTFEFVFVGRGDPSKPMSDAAVNKALATMGFKGRQTAHGFRHLVSTALNELGYEKDWVERQLAHGDPDKIRGTYNKATYLDPRRKMMQAWADYLDKIKRGGEVVPLRRENRREPMKRARSIPSDP
ncbi:MAG TPA: tyrosine-type recombinase/integrase [Rudaea sp.]|nr:tyrosine-type recombinase/integrase [Rudaea sp.]